MKLSFGKPKQAPLPIAVSEPPGSESGFDAAVLPDWYLELARKLELEIAETEREQADLMRTAKEELFPDRKQRILAAETSTGRHALRLRTRLQLLRVVILLGGEPMTPPYITRSVQVYIYEDKTGKQFKSRFAHSPLNCRLVSISTTDVVENWPRGFLDLKAARSKNYDSPGDPQIYVGPMPQEVALKAKRAMELIGPDHVMVMSPDPSHFNRVATRLLSDPILVVWLGENLGHPEWFRLATWGVAEDLQALPQPHAAQKGGEGHAD